MRISIWQQWASNHSAAFTIMGKFSTPDDALHVSGIFKDILREVATWKQQDYAAKWQAYLAENHIEQPTPLHKDDFEADYYAHPEPTEIEQRFATQYNLTTWFHTLDYALNPATAPDVVLVADCAVIVDEDLIGAYTWTGYWPFEELMRKFGSEQIAICCEFGGTAKITLRCTAPDNPTVTELMQQVETDEDAHKISITGLTFAGAPLDTDWFPGTVTRDGLAITYTYREWNSGRIFAALVAHLQARHCTDIEYTFETEGLDG